MSNCSASPPQIAQRLEGGQGALTRFNRFAEPAGDHIYLSQAGFSVRFDFIQIRDRCKLGRFVAVGDRDIRTATRHDMRPPAPVMPGGAAARVADLVDEKADLIEGLDVLGVFSEGKLAIPLLDDRVDAAEPVGVRVGQQVEAIAVELLEGLADSAVMGAAMTLE